jgi:hypothetical protein
MSTNNWEWNNLSGESDGKSIGISNVANNAIIPPPAPSISSNNSTFSNHCTPTPAVPTVPPPTFTYNTIPMGQSQFSTQVKSLFS